MIRLKPLRPTEILGRRAPLGSLVEAGGSRLPESGRARTFGACKKFTGAGFWCRTQVGLRRARGPGTRFVLVCSGPQRWQVAAGGLISPPPALPQNHDLRMMQEMLRSSLCCKKEQAGRPGCLESCSHGNNLTRQHLPTPLRSPVSRGRTFTASVTRVLLRFCACQHALTIRAKIPKE